MTLGCDGCRCPVKPEAIKFATADGHEARYCEDCWQEYRQFNAACLVAEEKFNRLLDLEIEAIRERTSLLIVPQDFPRPPRPLQGQPIVLA